MGTYDKIHARRSAHKVVGSTNKKTGHSALSRPDNDAGSHAGQPDGHWRSSGSGYERCEHHSQIIKHGK